MAPSTPSFLSSSTLIFLSCFPFTSLAASSDCGAASFHGACHDPPKALRLKVVAMASITVASMLGVCLPLASRSVPALRPGSNLFVVVKAFASGVILATGYMHVFPDSFNDLSSPCLPPDPWRKFPFTTFIAMLSAVLTMMVDSFMMAYHSRRYRSSAEVADHPSPTSNEVIITPAVVDVVSSHGHGHGHGVVGEVPSKDCGVEGAALRRNRVVAQVLEMGIVVHSVVIGLSMGTSQNPCTIKPLVAALCFHQLFEGIGLGGCILQAEYGRKARATMVFFFSFTTPLGIALGIAVSKAYSSTSAAALVVVGVLNAASAGILNYMALVDLLAADFMGPHLQSSFRLQAAAYAAVLVGAGGMSVMAKWA